MTLAPARWRSTNARKAVVMFGGIGAAAAENAPEGARRHLVYE